MIGCDGSEVASYASPSLATIDVPLEEIGRVGVEILWDQVHGEATEACSVRVRGSLRSGESAAAPGIK